MFREFREAKIEEISATVNVKMNQPGANQPGVARTPFFDTYLEHLKITQGQGQILQSSIDAYFLTAGLAVNTPRRRNTPANPIFERPSIIF